MLITHVISSQSGKIAQLLQLGDDALILGHRNSEWCGHGPVLEQDIAITNISLDLIGQARNFYQYAAALLDDGSTEDSLAYLRDAEAFRNHLLVEQPRGDWAFTIARQYLFSQYQHLLYQQLQDSDDPQLAAIAAKSLKEVTYHVRWSSEWMIRLGDGTDLSHQKIRHAVDECWPFVHELFEGLNGSFDQGSSPHQPPTVDSWLKHLQPVFEAATLSIPSIEDLQTITPNRNQRSHSIHLTELLDEMQSLHRLHPGVSW